MHVPKAERVARWIACSEQDLDVARRLRNVHPNLACYHAQQASEKALKAYLTELQGDSVATHLAHVLVRALEELSVKLPAVVEQSAVSLDAVYLPTRHPDALDFADAACTFGTEDADLALARAERVIGWVRSGLFG